MKKIFKKLCYRTVDLISIVFYPLCRVFGKERVRILLYHSVNDVPGGMDFSFSVIPTAAFARQMDFLSKNGFNVLTLDELIESKDKNRKLPPKSVIITFDDGFSDNYNNAFPILMKNNFKATFFIATDYINSASVFPWPKFQDKPLSQYQGNETSWLPLSKQNILDMSASGACFGSHTKTHCSLTGVDESQAIEEVKDSKECLEGILSQPVRSISYPFNRTNKVIKGLAAAAGYRAALCGEGSNTLSGDFFELRRIEIKPQDSLAMFKRKVEGAYDWYFYLLSVYVLIRRVLSIWKPARHEEDNGRINL